MTMGCYFSGGIKKLALLRTAVFLFKALNNSDSELLSEKNIPVGHCTPPSMEGLWHVWTCAVRVSCQLQADGLIKETIKGNC